MVRPKSGETARVRRRDSGDVEVETRKRKRGKNGGVLGSSCGGGLQVFSFWCALLGLCVSLP
ncbi:hypothetical protein A2U01_0041262, partial [Trifolium medium]|nr:hypothetical protein [Trifolium medium]